MDFPREFPLQEQKRHPGFEYEMIPRPIYDDEKYNKVGNLLKDKVAIITGGDSGIGRAVAVTYAKQGADLVIVYYDEHKDAEDTKNIIEDIGRKCTLISGDIGESSFCKNVIEQTIKEYGKIDILVNNAAVQYEQKDFKDITDEQFDKTMKTNVYGTFYMTREALRYLKEGSSIINTTSVVAFRGSEHLIDYSVSKGAMEVMTRSLSKSIASKGIRVNAVAPGPIWTPFIPSTVKPEDSSKFGQDTAMGRAGQPVECSGAYLFLATENASYITGQTIHVNGGEIVNS